MFAKSTSTGKTTTQKKTQNITQTNRSNPLTTHPQSVKYLHIISIS